MAISKKVRAAGTVSLLARFARLDPQYDGNVALETKSWTRKFAALSFITSGQWPGIMDYVEASMRVDADRWMMKMLTDVTSGGGVV